MPWGRWLIAAGCEWDERFGVRRRKCDKMTARQETHVGPFNVLMEEHPELVVERCQACGNVVIGRRQPETAGKSADVKGAVISGSRSVPRQGRVSTFNNS